MYTYNKATLNFHKMDNAILTISISLRREKKFWSSNPKII